MTCDRCDGHGMVYVSERWAEQQAPDDPTLHLAVLAAQAVVDPYVAARVPVPREYADALAVALHKVEHLRYRQAVARESVYPCPVCRTEQFERWSGGHYRFGHDELSCPDCLSNGWARTTRTKKAS